MGDASIAIAAKSLLVSFIRASAKAPCVTSGKQFRMNPRDQFGGKA
jgi:hypothetical protein